LSSLLRIIIPSSCTAPVSVIDAYKVDASQIAIGKFFDQNLAYKDSIDVPDIHRDTILDALLAVYNAEIPERDTVVDIFDIHILFKDMGDVYAQVDTTFFSLSDLDSLMNLYNINPFHGIFSESHIGFNVQDKYNQLALIKEFEKVDGLIHANSLYFALDGTDIEAEIYNDYVELIYSYPWDLCPMACQYRRFWKFKVYYDCSVEFVESYGDSNPELNINSESNFITLSLYPNPVSDLLNFKLKSNSNSLKLEVFDITGKKVKTEHFSNQEKGEFKKSIDISDLKSGLYFCKFKSGDKQVTRKLVKE